MLIVHVVNQASLSSGGPIAVVAGLSAQQKKEGHHVTIFSKHTDHFDLDVPLFSFSGKGADIRNRTRFILSFVSHVRRADAVHLHGFWTPHLCMASVVARLLGRKVYITPHGSLHPWSFSHKSFKKKIAYRLWCRFLLLDIVNGVHALNDREKHIFTSIRDVKEDKIFVIANAVSENIVRSSPREYPSERYFLFLGRFHLKKGIDLLLSGYSLYLKKGGRLPLRIYGPDDGVGEDVSALLSDYRLEPHASMHQAIYGEEKLRVMGGASWFVLPSRQEGFSMALIESLSVGTPLIISDECNFEEAFDRDLCLGVELNAESVCNALIEAERTDAATWRTKSEAGRRLVQSEYVWPHISREVVAMYAGKRTAADI